MNKNVRLVLLLALIAVMIVMTAVFASAATTVSDADGFKEAVAAGGEITLDADITLDEGIIIDKDVTINGGDHTITFTVGTKLETPVNNSSGVAARQVESYGFNFAGGTAKLQKVTVVAPTDTTADVGARIGIFHLSGADADVTLEDVKTDGGYYPIMFAAPSKLTVNDTSNDHSNTVIGTNMGYQYVMGSSTVAYVDGKVPTFVQNGGTFTAQTAATKSDMMRFESGMNFTVNDGIWDGFGNLYYSRGDITYGDTVITVNGGEFYSNSCIFSPNGSYDLYVYGGSFYSEGGAFNLRSTKEGAVCVFENATMNTGDSNGCIQVASDKPYNISVKNCNLYGYAGVRFNANITEALTLTIDGCTFRNSRFATSDPEAEDNDTDAGTGGMIVRYGTVSSAAVKITGATVTIKNCDIDTTKYWNGQDVTSKAYVFQNAYGTFIVENNTVVHNGSPMFLMNNNSTWTVNGGSYTHTGSSALLYVSDSTMNVTINGGTFTHNGTGVLLQKNNGKIAIENATLIQNAEGKDLIVTTAGRNGYITIEKSTLIQNAEGKDLINTTAGINGYITIEKSTLTHSAGGNVLNVAAATSGAAQITFNDVTCTGVVTVAEVAEGNVTPVISFVDVTYTSKDDPSGVIIETSAKWKYFEINGVQYGWADAMEALQAGDTVTIIGPVDWPLEIETDKAFTLDAGEYTLPSLTVTSGNVTLSNVAIASDGSTGLTVAAGAAVTLDSCNITGNVAISVTGSLSVSGSTLTATSGQVVQVLSGNANAVTISDSTLWGNGSQGCVAVYSADAKSITITDSNLYGYRGLRFYTAVDGGTYTIEGCTYRPQYTGTEDAISDYCVNAILVAVDASVTNCTFNITDCDINNTVYGTGETLESFEKMSSASIMADNASMNNTWNFTDCEIVWTSTATAFPAVKGNPVNLENCTVTYTGGGYMFGVSSANTWTITGGTYTHNGAGIMVRISDGGMHFLVDGATFVNNSDINMFVLNNGELTVSNATLTQNGTATMIEFGATQSGPLTITDSTLDSGDNLTINVQGKHPVFLTNVTVDSITIAENYPAVVALVDVTFDEGELVDPSGVAVISTKYNFKIGDTAYTWEEVMAAVKAGDTIVLVGDWGAVLEITAPVAFTLDANGKSVGGFTVAAGCNVTIVNCKVSVGVGVVLTVSEGATVTLGEGNSFTNTGSSYLMNNYGTLTITGGAYAGAIHNGKGTVTIENGTFTHSGTFTHANGGCPIIWMNDKEATTTINGGTFTKTASEHAKDCIIGTNDGNTKIVINGGRFEILGETYGHVANLNSCDVVEINGGTFISHNANYPVIRINAVHGTRYAESGSEAGTPRASKLQNFTTTGGSCAIQIDSNYDYEWHFTVENVTVNDAAKSVFVVNSSAAAATVTIKGGRYTLTGETADASVLNVIKGNVILDGAMFINNNATSTAAITAGEGANVTLNNVIVLANNGDAYVSATETFGFGSAFAKFNGMTYSLWTAMAGDTTNEGLQLDVGASARTTADLEGIRFAGSAAYVKGATYGILIAPADYVAVAGAFTKEALDAWAVKTGTTGTIYVAVEAQNSLHYDNTQAPTVVYFSATLTNIQTYNYGRSFAAVPFVTIDGVTTYGDYNSANNARSLKEVATALLAQDYAVEITEEYTAEQAVADGYIHVMEDGTFSKYTASQIAVLKSYAGY